MLERDPDVKLPENQPGGKIPGKDFPIVIHKLYYQLVSPEGLLYETASLQYFCDVYGLSYQMLCRAAKQNQQYEGWTIYKREGRESYAA